MVVGVGSVGVSVGVGSVGVSVGVGSVGVSVGVGSVTVVVGVGVTVEVESLPPHAAPSTISRIPRPSSKTLPMVPLSCLVFGRFAAVCAPLRLHVNEYAVASVVDGVQCQWQGEISSDGKVSNPVSLPALGEIRTFVTFATTIAPTYPDKRRQPQTAYVLGGSGVPSKWLAIDR